MSNEESPTINPISEDQQKIDKLVEEIYTEQPKDIADAKDRIDKKIRTGADSFFGGYRNILVPIFGGFDTLKSINRIDDDEFAKYLENRLILIEEVKRLEADHGFNWLPPEDIQDRLIAALEVFRLKKR